MARRNFTQRAREIIQEIPIGLPHAQALWSMVKYVPTEERYGVIAQALAVARAIGNKDARVRALAIDIWHSEILPLEDLYPLWCEHLRILASCTRPDLLHSLGKQAPFISALGGKQAIEETVQAITEVGRWFP